jgi:transcriptional regulator with XRE-family HTH domain
MSSTGQGTDLARTIGRNIRQARRSRGLRQRELAVVLDMSPQHLSDWERGAYRPNDTNLIRVGEALDRDFAWFFGDNTDRVPA